MIDVGVSGGYGRMGSMISALVEEAEDLALTGRYDPKHGDPSMLQGSSVIVEVTNPAVVMHNLAAWRELGCHVVVGTSGFDRDRVAAVEELWADAPTRCLIVPNFSIGAVLMMRFAELAAPHFPTAEIIEAHHPGKQDAPSGTALATAHRIAAARKDHREVSSRELAPGARGAAVEGVPVHSVRLAGVIADQEVVVGDDGQTLTIGHRTTSREAFAPGVLVAIRGVATLDQPVVVGLDGLLGI